MSAGGDNFGLTVFDTNRTIFQSEQSNNSPTGICSAAATTFRGMSAGGDNFGLTEFDIGSSDSDQDLQARRLTTVRGMSAGGAGVFWHWVSDTLCQLYR